jgi:hypothetical protein
MQGLHEGRVDFDRKFYSLLSQIRATATTLRTPDVVKVLGSQCPSVCPTRWIYDYSIAKFIVSHFQEASELVTLDPEVKDILPMLEKLDRTVTLLEKDDTSLAAVYPAIRSVLQFFEVVESRIGMEDLKEMYRDSKNVIKKRTLDTVDYIFQLTYVSPPKGREDARRSLNGESIMDEEHAELMKEIEEELEDFRQGESFGDEDRLRMVEGEIVVDETGEEPCLIDEEQDSEASQQTISPEEDIANFSGREDVNAGLYYRVQKKS